MRLLPIAQLSSSTVTRTKATKRTVRSGSLGGATHPCLTSASSPLFGRRGFEYGLDRGERLVRARSRLRTKER
jgi:hypothetical protein